MMEGDGKCRAEAEARGLPADRDICISGTQMEMMQRARTIGFLHNLRDVRYVLSD